MTKKKNSTKKMVEKMEKVEPVNFARVGERLRYLREDNHWTQVYVAYEVNVEPSHISNIEHGATVSLPLLVKLCDLYDVTMDYILRDEYSNPPEIMDNEILHQVQKLSEDNKRRILEIIKILK